MKFSIDNFNELDEVHNFVIKHEHLEDVVALRIAQVPGRDLGDEVPAAEGSRRELDPANVEQHAGHCRQGVPLEAQVGKPRVPTMRTSGESRNECPRLTRKCNSQGSVAVLT